MMHAVHDGPAAAVRLGAVDLNLLPVLDALLHERHVTRAAKRVGLSQSAASHALARLRDLLGDPLLTRAHDGMKLTPRAEELRAPVRRALETLEWVVRPPEPFDPETARRTIRVGTTDFAELVLLPGLLEALASRAPGIDIWAIANNDRGVDPVTRGEIDIALAPSRPADRRLPGIRSEELFAERFVCLVRADHPITRARGGLTLERYLASRHAFIAPRGRRGGVVDDALAARGLERRIALAVPHFLGAPFIVARTDLILTVAERVATEMAAHLPLAILEPPLKLDGFVIAAYWHERSDADPALAWVRARLAEIGSRVDDGRVKVAEPRARRATAKRSPR
jgi:DNA-binding transcriptional LysR family regulator